MTKSTLDKDKAIVVFSGGQDSTTCLFYAKKHFKEVELVTFNYGQRHDTEIEVARKIAKAQNFKYGETFSEDILQEILENCAPSYISGISILGGEPFCNLNISLKIARAFRERFGYSKTIWIWTGFLFEYLKHQTDERRELLELTDILVDGLFMYQLYKPNLPYKGSLNQRVIDVQDSLRSHGIIEYV